MKDTVNGVRSHDSSSEPDSESRQHQSIMNVYRVGQSHKSQFFRCEMIDTQGDSHCDNDTYTGGATNEKRERRLLKNSFWVANTYITISLGEHS